MSNQKNGRSTGPKKRGSGTAALVLVVALAAGGAGYYYFTQDKDEQKATSPVVADQGGQKPQEGSKQPAEPVTNGSGGTPPAKTPAEPSKPAAEPQSGDIITFKGFTGSGSVPLQDRQLANEAYKLERLDWSESNRTVTIHGKLRAFEAVGNFRVRDENKVLLVPEGVIMASEGAPAWGEFQAKFSLAPEFKGKVLHVEFYVKSANDGSIIHLLPLKLKPE